MSFAACSNGPGVRRSKAASGGAGPRCSVARAAPRAANAVGVAWLVPVSSVSPSTGSMAIAPSAAS